MVDEDFLQLVYSLYSNTGKGVKEFLKHFLKGDICSLLTPLPLGNALDSYFAQLFSSFIHKNPRPASS